jgi:hypothetical protein
VVTVPSEAADKAHELVQIIAPQPTNKPTDKDSERPEAILLPFDLFTDFAAQVGVEDSSFHYAERRKQLNWDR